VTKLQNRAISAKKALDCCVASKLTQEQLLRDILDSLLTEALSARSRSEFDTQIALLPAKFSPRAPRRLIRPIRIIRVVRGAPLVLGAIILFGVEAMNSILTQTAALEVLTGVIRALDEVTRTLEPDCRLCIRKNVWRQTNQEKVICSRLQGRKKGSGEFGAGPAIRVLVRSRKVRP